MAGGEEQVKPHQLPGDPKAGASVDPYGKGGHGKIPYVNVQRIECLNARLMRRSMTDETCVKIPETRLVTRRWLVRTT